ncbi:hypothetical protein J7K86_00235 [bacterium]|nr:hypothetical protein [bacterium]
MKYQVIQTELAAQVFAKSAEEAIKKVNQQLAGFSRVDDILGRPEKIGPNTWRVPVCSIKIGGPVEAQSEKQAIEKVCRALGLFPNPTMIAVPVF